MNVLHAYLFLAIFKPSLTHLTKTCKRNTREIKTYLILGIRKYKFYIHNTCQHLRAITVYSIHIVNGPTYLKEVLPIFAKKILLQSFANSYCLPLLFLHALCLCYCSLSQCICYYMALLAHVRFFLPILRFKHDTN